MLQAGTIRRIRQTVLTTSLAEGALIAWLVPDEKLESAYQWLKENDPYTGHIVLRECDDPQAQGARYRLWTTLKVPQNSGRMQGHCAILSRHIGALDCVPLPVVGMFALSVGHTRRAGLQVGDQQVQAPSIQRPTSPSLNQLEWDVLFSLKESLKPEELTHSPWAARAVALNISEQEYCSIAQGLDQKQVIGRFATFLDHQGKGGKQAGTRASGLIHWVVEKGYEERAGSECGRHNCMTHCYWRSGGEKLGGAQIMGVIHGSSKQNVLDHKAAIDAHLAQQNIPIKKTFIYWSQRAEIRPSEINPRHYHHWLQKYQ